MITLQERALVEARIAELDGMLGRLGEGREILEQLRAGYERQLAFIDAGAPQGAGNGGANVAGEGGAEPSEPRTLGRPDSRRRAKAGADHVVAATRAGSADRESAPTAEGSTRTDGPYECAQPGCGFTSLRAHGLAIHRARKHGNSAASVPTRPPVPDPLPQPLGADVARADRRDIDEECPRGCGRRFRWEPTLLSHIPSCKGAARAEPGGGISVTSPAAAGASV